MTLCRDMDGSSGCWDGDSLLSHPTFPCGQMNQLAEMCVAVKEGEQR